MSTDELIDIIVAPDGKSSEELVLKVAEIIGRDPSYARAILNAKIPQISCQGTDAQRAERIVQQIKALGLMALACKDSDLQKPLHLFKANTLEFGGDGIIFKDKNSQLLKLGKRKVFLILTGIARTFEEKEVVTKVKKLNITATLLSGGIPISRTTKQKTVETTVQSEGVIRLFEKNGMDSGVEIRQASFNYACLGTEMALSSQQNLNLITRKIKEFYAEARFDDRLSRMPATGTASKAENLDVNCKLMYRYYGEKGKSPGGETGGL